MLEEGIIRIIFGQRMGNGRFVAFGARYCSYGCREKKPHHGNCAVVVQLGEKYRVKAMLRVRCALYVIDKASMQPQATAIVPG